MFDCFRVSFNAVYLEIVHIVIDVQVVYVKNLFNHLVRDVPANGNSAVLFIKHDIGFGQFTRRTYTVVWV